MHTSNFISWTIKGDDLGWWKYSIIQTWPCIHRPFKCLLGKGFPALREGDTSCPVGCGVYTFQRLITLTPLAVVLASGVQAARGTGLRCLRHFSGRAFPPGGSLCRCLCLEPICYPVCLGHLLSTALAKHFCRPCGQRWNTHCPGPWGRFMYWGRQGSRLERLVTGFPFSSVL